MNSQLWEQANALSKRPYAITSERDTLANGQEIILLRHPELRGCKAQGNTIKEAYTHLEEARVDYIYALLELGLPIPAPNSLATTQTDSSGTSETWQIPMKNTEDSLDQVSDQIVQSNSRELTARLSYSGDLVKVRST